MATPTAPSKNLNATRHSPNSASPGTAKKTSPPSSAANEPTEPGPHGSTPTPSTTGPPNPSNARAPTSFTSSPPTPSRCLYPALTCSKTKPPKTSTRSLSTAANPPPPTLALNSPPTPTACPKLFPAPGGAPTNPSGVRNPNTRTTRLPLSSTTPQGRITTARTRPPALCAASTSTTPNSWVGVTLATTAWPINSATSTRAITAA